ncbi:MAG TPA: hypothetical protein VLA32_07135 [Anaerolineales bacterium]|jgi:hypothetical protein|nr:hypothetical protein [Anaerolineales bacterium]
MFSSDSDRIIPRRRIKFGNLIIQFLLFLFVILFFIQMIFDSNTTNWFEDISDYLVLLFVGFFILTSLIGFVIRWFHFRKWTIFAEERGLTVEKKSWVSSPVIQGTYRGHQITIADTSESRGRSREHFTNFMMTLNTPTTSTFTIKKRSITHANRELTNDEEVDKKLTIKINSKMLLEQILKTRRLRQGLLELGERSRTRDLYLNGKVLHYKESGQVSDPEYMQAVLNYMIDLIKLAERVEQIGR